MKKAEFDVVYLHEGDVIATSSAACDSTQRYLWFIRAVDHEFRSSEYPTGYAVGEIYEYDASTGSWNDKGEEQYRFFDGGNGFSNDIEAGKWYHVDAFGAGCLYTDNSMTLCTKEHTFN